MPEPTRSAITASDADDDSDPAIGPVDLKLTDGGNYTAVAHLNADGDPTATLFRNDTSKTKAVTGPADRSAHRGRPRRGRARRWEGCDQRPVQPEREGA